MKSTLPFPLDGNLSECAPATIRGTLTNTYQFFFLVGATMVVTCNWGLEARTDQWAYRVILILQFFIPFLMISGGAVSPRFSKMAGSEGQGARGIGSRQVPTEG